MKDKTSSSGLFRGKRNVVLCLDSTPFILCFAKFSNHDLHLAVSITPKQAECETSTTCGFYIQDLQRVFLKTKTIPNRIQFNSVGTGQD